MEPFVLGTVAGDGDGELNQRGEWLPNVRFGGTGNSGNCLHTTCMRRSAYASTPLHPFIVSLVMATLIIAALC